MPTNQIPRPIVRPERALVTEPTLERLGAAERAIADDVLAAAKARFAAAAASDNDEVSTPEGRFMSKQSPTRRASVRTSSRHLTAQSATVLAAEFGRHLAVAQQPVLHLEQRPRPHLHFEITPEMQAEIKVKIAKKKAEQAAAAKDLAEGAAYKRMRMTITKVSCLAESGEWSPSDEFSMGGQFIDPFGKVTKVGEFEVMTDADAGETVYPNRVFADWKLDTGDGWPKVYTVLLNAAEKDDGGFGKFLQDLWEEVSAEVKVLIATGIGAAVGAAAVPVVGAIVGAVVGALVGWIASLFDDEDDIMQVRALTMTLGACTKSYYDWAELTTATGWTLPNPTHPKPIRFGEDGSRYEVSLSWRVVK
jgi:hypothetical protein